MADRTIASPIASTASIDRTPIAWVRRSEVNLHETFNVIGQDADDDGHERLTTAPTTTDRLRAGRQPPHPARARAMTLLSGIGLVGLVTAVALRQPPAIAVPPGLVAAVAYVTVRRHLRRQASVVASATSGQTVSDRSYAVAYPILAHGVLVGLFAAFAVVHEASWTINDSAIHAVYWAAMGTIWLLPATVQTWQASHPPEDPPARPDSGRTGLAPRVGMFARQR